MDGKEEKIKEEKIKEEEEEEEEKRINVIKAKQNNVWLAVAKFPSDTTKKIKKNLDIEIGALSYIYFALFLMELTSNVNLHFYVRTLLYFATAMLLTLAKRKIKKGPMTSWFVNTISKDAEDCDVEDLFGNDK